MLDPDFEMGAGEEEGSSQKIFLGPSRLQFGLKIRAGGGGNGPSPGSAIVLEWLTCITDVI